MGENIISRYCPFKKTFISYPAGEYRVQCKLTKPPGTTACLPVVTLPSRGAFLLLKITLDREGVGVGSGWSEPEFENVQGAQESIPKN